MKKSRNGKVARYAKAYGPLFDDPSLDPGEVIQYLLYCILAGAKGYHWLSKATVARILGCEARTIMNREKTLLKRGLITKRVRKGRSSFIYIKSQKSVYGQEAINGFLKKVKRLKLESAS